MNKKMMLLICLLFTGTFLYAQDQTEPQPVEAVVEQATFKYAPPQGYIAAIELGNMTAIEKAFWSSALGEIFKEEEMAEICKKVKERFLRKIDEADEFSELAAELEEKTSLKHELGAWSDEHLQNLDVFESARMVFYPQDTEELGDDDAPVYMVSALLKDKKDQNYQEKLDSLIKVLEESDDAVKEDKKIPAFTLKKTGYKSIWFLMDGQEIHVGINCLCLADQMKEGTDIALKEAINTTGKEGVPVVTGLLDMTSVYDQIKKGFSEEKKEKTDRRLGILGLDDIQSITCSVSMNGRCIRESFRISTKESPKGLLGLFKALDGDKPTPLPMPSPELLIIDSALDVGKMIELIQAILKEDAEGEEESIEDELVKMLFAEGAKVFSGQAAFGLSAPKPGSMVPRFALAFGMGDPEKFNQFLELAKKSLTGITFSESDYKEVTMTIVNIPNNPAPLVPCYAVLNNTFYMAESTWTLKSLISNLKKGETGGLIAHENLPALPDGMKDPFMKMAYDPKEIYTMVHTKYMPMLQLTMNTQSIFGKSKRDPLLDSAEFPMMETITAHLTQGSGGGAALSNSLYMSMASPMGDPYATAFQATIFPIFAKVVSQAMNKAVGEEERDLCKLRAAKIYAALKAYKESFGGGQRYPSHLGELVTRGLVDDFDYFLVPSDEEPASVEYETEDGEIEEFEVSYKYLPDSKFKIPKKDLRWVGFYDNPLLMKTEFEHRIIQAEYDNEKKKKEEETKTVLFYELNENDHNGRIIVCDDGKVYHVREYKFKKFIDLK